MQIPLIGKLDQGRYPINFFLEPERKDQRAALIGTPGLDLWYDSGIRDGSVRGLHVVGDYVYAVIGDTVYKVDATGAATALSTIIGTSTGYVWMADDGTSLMIVDGDDGYVLTISTGAVLVIADTDFPTPSSLTYQDGYFIITRADTGEIYISALNDPTDWDALDYATAEGAPDDALVVKMDHRELWIFGSISIEVFYNSGDADFPFERIPGSFIEKGLGAVASPVKLDNSLFWLSDKGQVFRADGYTPQIVSTRQIDKAINKYSTFSDAIGYGYEQEGHSFYVLTFPTARKTWVHDAATKLWHQRADMKGYQHRSNCYAYFDNKHLVGDYENGKIYELDPGTYSDAGLVLRSQHTFPPIEKDRRKIRHDRLEIEFTSGVGLATGQGSDPQAMLQRSDDDGKTWSNEYWSTIGKIGKYKNRAIWRRLKSARHRVYRVTITDPIEREIVAPYLRAQIGKD